MKKVAFFVNDLNSGGIENYLLRFLQYYNGKITPIVICKSGEFGHLEEKYQAINKISLVKLKIGYLDFKAYIELFRYLRELNPNTVVDFTGNFAGFPLLVSRLAKISNRIVFYRGATNHFKESYFKKGYNNFLNLLILKNATSILSNSKAALKFFFKNQNDSRFEVIYNGIDADTFLKSKQNLRNDLEIPATGFVVSHIGRYTEAKNHKTIIEVAIELCKKNKNIYFIMCGKDVDTTYRKRVEEEKLQNQIKTLGYRNDVISILNTSDLFYFPSLTEGQPNALLEALVAGLPFVASNIDPIKETVPPDLHYLLVNPNDVLAAVKLIEQIVGDQVLQKKLDLRVWAKKNYSHEELFNKFYNKL